MSAEQKSVRRLDFLNRRSLAWALYDCGNSAFALSSIAVLFPLFIGSYWSAGAEGAVVTARLAWTTAAASLVVLILAPLLGALADSGGYRKRFLFLLGLVGAVSTVALALVPEGAWRLALVCFFAASIGFYSANVFYDALIFEVSSPRNYNLVSALGYSLGYVGSALLLSVQLWILSAPDAAGFDSIAEVVRFAFVSVGIWWFLFMLPLMAVVPEPPSRLADGKRVLADAYRSLVDTMRHIRRYRQVALFLMAYTLYIAGVFTVIFMAVNFGQRLGFEQIDLVRALLITNFVGFPATLAYGLLGHRVGPKAATYLGLAVYAGVASWAVFLENVGQFYVMAILIGFVQGGVQAMSRSLYASLIPEDRSGEFFGFYNMLTKLAHVLGPFVVGVGTLMSDDPKAILIALLPLYLIGGVLLVRVRPDR
jgi:UMF1 family MFS transporter